MTSRLNKAALDLQTGAVKDQWGWDVGPVGPGGDPCHEEAGIALDIWNVRRARSANFPDLDLDGLPLRTCCAHGGGDAISRRRGRDRYARIERILYSPGSSRWWRTKVPALDTCLPLAADAQKRRIKTPCQKLVVFEKACSIRGAKSGSLCPRFTGLTGLMDAIRKGRWRSNKEIRYSQKTMLDLLEHEGDRKSRPFHALVGHEGLRHDVEKFVRRAFDGLEQTYSHVLGDAIPPPPSTWLDPPTVDDQQTPFGQLYQAVRLGVDPGRPDSAVDALNHVARALGLPEFTQQN